MQKKNIKSKTEKNEKAAFFRLKEGNRVFSRHDTTTRKLITSIYNPAHLPWLIYSDLRTLSEE